MKITGQMNRLNAVLGACADTANRWIGRGQKKNTAKSTGTPQKSMDPTEVLFPDQEEAPNTPHGPGRLQPFLEKSAQTLVERTDKLRDHKQALMAQMGDRANAEITLTTQALRVVIGLIWIGIAAWLFLGAGQTEGGASGMPVEHAQTLSATFLKISLAALAVAFGVTAFVGVMGKSDNKKIRNEAEKLGIAIAATSREFDASLNSFRTAMDRRADPVDAAFDLSPAHAAALEACANFREIGYLTGDGDEANRMFRGFSKARGGNPPLTPIFLIGVLLGGFVGAGYVMINVVPETDYSMAFGSAAASVEAISQYPWAVFAILGGSLLYATIGLIVSLAAGRPITTSAMSRAQKVAQDALRAGFTSQSAPRPIDVVRRIEDTVEVFRAGVGNARSDAAQRDHRGANHLRNPSFEFSEEKPDVPEWRHKDSSLTFVDTGFTTAPETWRTDAFAKKIDENGAGKPGSKRGRLSFKKSSRN